MIKHTTWSFLMGLVTHLQRFFQKLVVSFICISTTFIFSWAILLFHLHSKISMKKKRDQENGGKNQSTHLCVYRGREGGKRSPWISDKWPQIRHKCKKYPAKDQISAVPVLLAKKVCGFLPIKIPQWHCQSNIYIQ